MIAATLGSTRQGIVTPPAEKIHVRDAPISSKPYQPFGGSLSLMYDKSDEVLVCGPSGTGKSRGALEKLHLCMSKYPNSRGLILRKTRASLSQSAMVTYTRNVTPDDGSVKFKTGNQEYQYSNGSIIAVGGIDYYSKVMSSEYDMIYVQEATELSESDWEALITRCRFANMPYNQLFGDCNPNAPTHWLRRRCDARKMSYIKSEHEDNPTLFDHVTGEWTQRGINYIAKLDALTGVRYLRLRKGLWAAAEGMIYDNWDDNVHLIDRNKVKISDEWPRIWVIDFGFTAPFCWQCWAIDGDTRAYRIAEIYQTGLLVEEAVALIKSWMNENNEKIPNDVVCDHDAEDRATFEKHMDIETIPAEKSITPGIEAVKTRLKIAGDGKPRMFFLRDSLLEHDPALVDAAKPLCSEQEFEGYVWNDKKADKPKQVDDHGMDATRYLAMYLETLYAGWSKGMAS